MWVSQLPHNLWTWNFGNLFVSSLSTCMQSFEQIWNMAKNLVRRPLKRCCFNLCGRYHLLYNMLVVLQIPPSGQTVCVAGITFSTCNLFCRYHLLSRLVSFYYTDRIYCHLILKQIISHAHNQQHHFKVTNLINIKHTILVPCCRVNEPSF